MTDLHKAIATGNLTLYIQSVMKITDKSLVNSLDAKGRTPLHIACQKGNALVAKYLLFRGADTTIRDADDKLALECTPDKQRSAMTLLFSQAEAKRQSKLRKKDKKGNKEVESMDARYGEDDEIEPSVASPTTVRKGLIALLIPLLFLLFVNGFFFALKFIVCTMTFYLVAISYFIAEIAIKPPWYHHAVNDRDGLRMKCCPDYWQGWITDPKTDLGMEYEDVKFKSMGNYTLRGWHIPPPSQSANSLCEGNGVGIVMVHGGGRDRRAWLRHTHFLHRAGFGLLLFDLREHGVSDGKMRGLTFGISERYDVIAAANLMRNQFHYRKICAMGTSVGGSSVIMAAAIDQNIDAVVAENPITTCASLLDHSLVVYLSAYMQHRTLGTLMFKMFRRLCTFWLNWRVGNKPSKHCQALHCIDTIAPRPVLLMHGTNDAIVPTKHSEILFERCKEPKELYVSESAFHCGLYNTHPQEYEKVVLNFLKTHLLKDSGEMDAAELNGVGNDSPSAPSSPIATAKKTQ